MVVVEVVAEEVVAAEEAVVRVLQVDLEDLVQDRVAEVVEQAEWEEQAERKAVVQELAVKWGAVVWEEAVEWEVLALV